MKALILAAGFGVMLREIIHGQPKHMVSINGQPFLRHLVAMLNRHGINEIVFGIGYLPQSIKDEFKEYSFSEDARPVGTGGTLKNAEKFFSTDFLVINGDTYLELDYEKLMVWHLQQQKLITVVVKAKHPELSCGTYIMSPAIFSQIPSDTKISLEADILPKLKLSHQLAVYPINQRFIDIGSPEGYAEAVKELV